MEILKKESIIINKICLSKDEVIEELVNRLHESGILEDRTTFLNEVFKREHMENTYIDYDFAIPHGKSSAVKEPQIAFMRLEEPITWGETEEEKAQNIFLIAVPEKNKGDIHLEMLVKLSKKILKNSFRETLALSSNSDEIYNLINE